jgi:hypothetical protein
MRNNIYNHICDTQVSHKTALRFCHEPSTPPSVGHISLAQTCRQIRTEFMSLVISRLDTVRVRFKDALAFLEEIVSHKQDSVLLPLLNRTWTLEVDMSVDDDSSNDSYNSSTSHHVPWADMLPLLQAAHDAQEHRKVDICLHKSRYHAPFLWYVERVFARDDGTRMCREYLLANADMLLMGHPCAPLGEACMPDLTLQLEDGVGPVGTEVERQDFVRKCGFEWQFNHHLVLKIGGVYYHMV